MGITQRMRAVFVLGIVLLMTNLPSVQAQGGKDPRIERIRKQYAAIDSPSRQYTIRKHDNDYKNGHDSFTGYYQGKELRKIVVVSRTEQEQITARIYLRSEHVFFVDYVTASGSRTASSEELFYFAHDQLICWLGPGNTVKPANSTQARGAVDALLEWRREALAALSPQRILRR